MAELSKEGLYVANIIPSSLSNGEGIRFVLFVSGCKMHCEGCQNKIAQDYKFGTFYTIDEIYNIIVSDPLQKNVTYSGGEPFDNVEGLLELSKKLKKDNYNIWSYTGYTIESIKADSSKNVLLPYLDVVVDGRFIESMQEGAKRYTGSRNQRIIQVNQLQL